MSEFASGLGYRSRSRAVGRALLAFVLLTAASVSLLVSSVSAAGAAPAATSPADPVVVWQPGWSWTYQQTFSYTSGSDHATAQESVTYTVAGATTYKGFDAYEVTFTGTVSSGSGSADGYDLTVNGGSVTGTEYVRRSDLAIIEEDQTQTINGSVKVSLFSVGFNANVNLDLTPTPAWRQADYPLHDGDSWTTNESIAYSGDYSYSSSVKSGSSPLNGTISLDAASNVAAIAVDALGGGTTPADQVTTNDASSGASDVVAWTPAYANVASENLTMPLTGGPVTMVRTLTGSSTPAPANVATASLQAQPSCAGGTVTLLGATSPAMGAAPVTATLDESPVGATSQTQSATTAPDGTFQVSFAVPTAPDGLEKAGVTGAWGIVADVGSTSPVTAVTTLVVPTDHCTSLKLTGPSGAPLGPSNPSFTATLTDTTTGTPISGATVSFTLSDGATTTNVTDGSGMTTSAVPLNGPARDATVTASFTGTDQEAPATAQLPFTVEGAPTTTKLASSANPSACGTAVGFTATVSAASGTPTGTVQFTVDSTDLGGPVTLSGGVATSGTVNDLTAGPHDVAAHYIGDTTDAPSDDSLVQTVNPCVVAAVGTTTTVTPSPGTVVARGGPVTLTVGVTPASGATPPAGTVQLSIDGTPYGSPLTLTDGTASTVVAYTPPTQASPSPPADPFLVLGNHKVAASFTPTDATAFAASTSTPVNLTVSGLQPVAAFVTKAYHDFLGRAPTSGELAFWSASLQQPGSSPAQLLSVLANSNEWVAHIVNQFYEDTLDRAGDPGGLAYWEGQIESGAQTVAQVAAQFYASDEYYNDPDTGGGTVKSWVDDLYTKLLHRSASADPTGEAYWIGQVHQPSDRFTVAYGIYQSLESRMDRVADLYWALLYRAPDAGGQAFWAGQILTQGDIALAESLAASPEYQADANKIYGTTP